MTAGSKNALTDNAARDLAEPEGSFAFDDVSTNELLNINSRLGDLYSQRSPDAQERALAKWLEDAQEALSNTMATYLPCEFYLRFIDHAQVKGQPVILPPNTITVHLFTESVKEHIIVTVPPRFMRLAINACYGGVGKDPVLETLSGFTVFEHSFVGDMSRALTKSALRVSSNEHAVSTNLSATLVETDQENVKLMTSEGLDITWELQIAEHRETFRMHIPIRCISAFDPPKPVMARSTGSETDPEWSNHLREKLDNTISKLKAVIMLGEFSLGDVSALQPGNTIELGKAGSIEVTIDSEENSIFSGKMGQKNGQYAVNIERNVEKK